MIPYPFPLRGWVTCRVAFLAAVSLVSAARAQQPGGLPPVRQLGPRLAITADSLASVAGIRALSDGRVLVNDATKRRLLLYDASLSHAIVIADTTSSTKKAYGVTQGGLIAWAGDSSLLVIPEASAMLVIDPAGAIARVIAPPVAADVGSLALNSGKPAFDAAGRLLYRNIGTKYSVGELWGRVRPSEPPSAEQLAARPLNAIHDSVAITRADPLHRTVDTAGFLAKPMVSLFLVNPVRGYDDWAILTDGSVAFVRAADYHIDWIDPDGTRRATPRMAHEWHRLTDSERVVIVDSAQHSLDSLHAASVARRATRDSITRAAGGSVPAVSEGSVARVVAPEALPDYLPVFDQGAVTADADNHLWIRLGTTPPGVGALPAIYDVVSRDGIVIERVQLPPSWSIVGFGPGVVYLTVREGAGTVLAKYRIR